jgi:hypothetical protein
MNMFQRSRAPVCKSQWEMGGDYGVLEASLSWRGIQERSYLVPEFQDEDPFHLFVVSSSWVLGRTYTYLDIQH